MYLGDPDLETRLTTKLAAHCRGSSSPEPDACTLADLHGLIERGRTFPTIYVDPPWRYRNRASRGAAANHYPTLGFEELCRLPIQELAAPGAHLHLWATSPLLPDAFGVLSAWGFEYRTNFVWVKKRFGLGNYWRGAHELLLLSVRGKAKRFADRALRSWGEFEQGRHSEKPEQVRELIERASPGPRLELFGRRIVPGWVVWGDEISRFAFEAEEALHFPGPANGEIPALRVVAL